MSIVTFVYFWLCYIFPFLPACPGIGKREDADCIWAQAHGRNSLSDKGLGKQLSRLRIAVKGDDLEVFRLLANMDFDCGRMNRVIGGFCKRLVNVLGIPLIGQWEVLYAIWEADPKWYLENRDQLDVLWPRLKGYFTTYHVKLDSRERMIKRGCSKPLEVAHPAMLVRAVAIIWATGVAPIVEPVSPFTFWAHELWVWDENSVQGWCRRFFPSFREPYDGEQDGTGLAERIVNRIFPHWLLREWLGRFQHIWVGFVALRPPAPA